MSPDACCINRLRPGPAIDGPPVGSAMILGLSKQQFQSKWAGVFALYPVAEDLRMTERYLEDFAVGQTYGSGRFQIDEKRIKSFASEFDPQPFHLDAAAAQHTIFQGLVASGWHTAAVTMRLLVESELRPAGGIVGAGLDELRWPRPVRPGDELNIECEVLEVRPSKSRPDLGLIKVRMTTLNQNRETVLVSVGNLLVPHRPK
jgi:acyl dehydratase